MAPNINITYSCRIIYVALSIEIFQESKPAIDILTDEWEIDRNSITLGKTCFVVTIFYKMIYEMIMPFYPE